MSRLCLTEGPYTRQGGSWEKSLQSRKRSKVNDKDFVVVPVPDTAKPAADGYAHTNGNSFNGGAYQEQGICWKDIHREWRQS